MDIRDSKMATWRDVVYAVMNKIKNGSLSSIYDEISSHAKCKCAGNEHWQAKVRQVLQQLRDAGLLVNPIPGTWALA